MSMNQNAPSAMSMMNAMGGPVGGASGHLTNPGTPTNTYQTSNDEIMKKLHTYIYDYFLRSENYDVARAMLTASTSGQLPLLTQIKQSPNQRQPKGAEDVDGETKDPELEKRPQDLPLPGIPFGQGPFLQDWWYQFWDIYNTRRNSGKSQATINYLHQQRAQQKQRNGMIQQNMDPAMQNNLQRMMNNGMMPENLKKTAMANAGNLNPAQLAQMQRMRQSQMTQGSQMERSSSQMDMGRSGSPGSGDAPSPKRQRLEGGLQQMGQRPVQPGQMPNNQVGLTPNNPPLDPPLDPAVVASTREVLLSEGVDPNSLRPEIFYSLAIQPTNFQRKSVGVYSESLKNAMAQQMNQVPGSNLNKGMSQNPAAAAAMGAAVAQGSPMSQGGVDAGMGDFGPTAMRPGMQSMQAAAQGGPNTNGNHALQDYQMQLMLLEQQNKKRLLMARQEQDGMQAHPGGMPPGGNGQFAQNMSPQGSRAGPSPNPNEMQRGTPKMNNSGTSPNGNMAGRGSPAPQSFDPNGMQPGMRPPMMMGPGNHMVPRSMPGQGPLTQQQLEMFARSQMMQNGAFAGGNPQMPPNMMQGPQPGQLGQPGQAPPNMTPRQGNQAMPPPPAPQQNNPTGTGPSSPAPPAPPTPSQTNKPKPGGKKESKAKGGKKNAATTGATPASEAEQPPTPTPQTPVTPMHANSFNQNKNANLPNGAGAPQPPNAGQPNNAGQPQASANPAQQPQPPSDMGGGGGPFGNLGDNNQFSEMNMNLDFGPMEGGDVLDNFDFDSFLNTENGDSSLPGFDAQFAFGDGSLEAGGDAMGHF